MPYYQYTFSRPGGWRKFNNTSIKLAGAVELFCLVEAAMGVRVRDFKLATTKLGTFAAQGRGLGLTLSVNQNRSSIAHTIAAEIDTYCSKLATLFQIRVLKQRNVLSAYSVKYPAQ